MTRDVRWVVAGLGVLLVAAQGRAQQRGAASEAPGHPVQQQAPTQTVAGAVLRTEPGALLLSQRGEPFLRLQLQETTRVVASGRPARVADIREGHQVRATYRREQGMLVALQVEVLGTAPGAGRQPPLQAGESYPPRPQATGPAAAGAAAPVDAPGAAASAQRLAQLQEEVRQLRDEVQRLRAERAPAQGTGGAGSAAGGSAGAEVAQLRAEVAELRAALAGRQGTGGAPPPAEVRGTVVSTATYVGTLQEVRPGSLVIADPSGTLLTLDIDRNTRVMRGGRRIEAGQLRSGTRVRARVDLLADGRTEATEVLAQPTAAGQ